MRIKPAHIPYIANKIILDLANSSFVKIKDDSQKLIKTAKEILEIDVLNERKLDEKTKELLESQEDEIEFMQIDRKNMFWMIKKKLADEFKFILDKEDRYNNLAHKILENLVNENLINYSVSENRVKNLIFSSIMTYLKEYEKLEDLVYEKISNYKRKLIPGSEEYDLVFEKLYQEELRKRGLL
ncbi:DUF507 family protein [Campylobacter sp.]|uniref:DUF507 family protein n=1 Tax=Campylobacter sp. TaxID=205 RepID=UPI0025BB0FED|nr:DUF507 family protein [Campylobacter sp.]